MAVNNNTFVYLLETAKLTENMSVMVKGLFRMKKSDSFEASIRRYSQICWVNYANKCDLFVLSAYLHFSIANQCN